MHRSMKTRNRKPFHLALAKCAASLVLTSAPALADPSETLSSQEPQVRLIDLRDLRAAFAHTIVEAHQLVGSIGAALGIQTLPAGEGVFVVKGESESLDALGTILDDFRTAATESYVVELLVASVDRAQAPAPGAAMPAGAIAHARMRQVLPRGREVELRSLDEVSFIRSWSPVVSDSAVGYDAQTDSIEHGLSVEAIVTGAGDGSVSISLNGAISHATLRQVQVTLTEGTLPYEVPTVRMRSIHAWAGVALDAARGPTVVTLLEGFEDGKVLVVAVGAARAR